LLDSVSPPGTASLLGGALLGEGGSIVGGNGSLLTSTGSFFKGDGSPELDDLPRRRNSSSLVLIFLKTN